MFLVSVASKRVSYSASLLFATLARGSISVVAKGLTLPQNCAKWTGEEGRRGEGTREPGGRGIVGS